jgi:phosphinothricin acetyltransferase
VREAQPADAAAIAAIYAPYVLETSITFELEPPTPGEFVARMAATQARFPYVVACENGEEGRVLGYAYVGPFKERAAYDWAVETSIYVGRDARGLGVGRALHAALEDACRAMGVTNLEACIAYPDEGGSVGFHEHLGYRMVGRFERCGYKLGAWRDMVWMEKHIAAHPDAPAPLRPWPEVRAGWARD